MEDEVRRLYQEGRDGEEGDGNESGNEGNGGESAAPLGGPGEQFCGQLMADLFVWLAQN